MQKPPWGNFLWLDIFAGMLTWRFDSSVMLLSVLEAYKISVVGITSLADGVSQRNRPWMYSFIGSSIADAANRLHRVKVLTRECDK